MKILDLVAKPDPIVKKRLSHGSRNAKSTSHMIQNIITVMATLLRKRICRTLQKAKFFSLMVNETKDLSKQEQVSFVVRYVDGNRKPVAIKERFLTLLALMQNLLLNIFLQH